MNSNAVAFRTPSIYVSYTFSFKKLKVHNVYDKNSIYYLRRPEFFHFIKSWSKICQPEISDSNFQCEPFLPGHLKTEMIMVKES